MSYDLYFAARVPEQVPTAEEIAGYFRGRPMYTVNEAQAWYENRDSGVYFGFQFRNPDADSDSGRESESEPGPSSGSTDLPVAFNLNYFRPHPFGLEAEPEVAAFVARFDLTVNDPQDAGMGVGEYSKEGFLRGWNAGNSFACAAVLAQHPGHGVLNLPSARIDACWRWNHGRRARQAAVGERAFVPQIFFFDMAGAVQTGVAWGDGIALLLPAVDLLIVPRRRLAPRRWFRRQDDMVVLTWAEVEPVASQYPRRAGEPVCYELFYDATPPDIERMILAREPPPALPQSIPFDQVLDAELISVGRGAG
jgi:hypothetical protein